MTAYTTLHTRLRTQRGRACEHKCVHCIEHGKHTQARDWARMHCTDGEDIWADYLALCRSCHITYDGSGHRVPHSEVTKLTLSRKNSGYRHTPEAIEKIRRASIARGSVPPWHPSRSGGDV